MLCAVPKKEVRSRKPEVSMIGRMPLLFWLPTPDFLLLDNRREET
jgi:hypothetical protein